MRNGKVNWFSKLLYSVPLCAAALHAQGQPAGTPEFFETKIRPVLAKNCYNCHTQTQMGGLRLDGPDGLQKAGKHGVIVTPGDPEKSALVLAIRQTDANLKMPMGFKLKDAEIKDIEAWVKAGAPWPKADKSATAAKGKNGEFVISAEARQHWAFQPLTAPPVPAPKDAKWSRTDIDKFVLSHLEKSGLKPVKAASKRDLIRRATLDLTGLPATYEEIQAFEKDTAPDAFAKVIDRLLNTPQYGERWGRYWLDVARYGEDDYRSLDPMRRGYNPYPNAFAYRDWVIQAMQDDMPYNLFVKAQLAGDLMDEKVRYKMLPATGFLGLGPWYYDNGSTEVTRADERHDRVDVITRGFLGLTVACARCHDHKYDPIPTKDYYALAGVFYNTIYEEYPRVPKKVLEEHLRIEEWIDQKQKMMGEIQQNQGTQLSESLAFATANYLQAVWEVSGPQKKDMATVVEARKLDFELLDRWVAYMAKSTDKYKNKEAWQAMMKKGGNPAEAKKLAEKFQEEVVAVMLARNELNEENKVIAAKALEGTKRKKRTNKPSNFVTNDDFCPGCNLRLKQLSEEDSSFYTEIFQRMLADAEDPAAMMAMGGRGGKPGVLAFRGWGLESRIGSEAQAQIAAIRKDVEEARKKLEPGYPYIHGVKDSETPVNINLAFRGDPMDLKEEVPRHFLSVLSPGAPVPLTSGSGRLELAEQVSKQPLAARVIVNRIWKGHFGTGLVDTPSNFGTMGERPSNPELLEYLAANFVKDGQSIKKLHRQIMLSSVYQLSTESEPTALAKDSANRLYWRFDRKRMDAEQVRDSILYVSGNLDKSLGGPSEDLTPSFFRRTVYGKVSRYKLDQYLLLFDFPSPNISAEKRFTTTVPIQRLFLMNSDFMQYEAEQLAKRVALEPNNTARVKKLYQIVYGREATPEEIALGIEYLKTEPMLEYEESKKRKPEGGPGGPGGRRGRGPGAEMASAKPAGDKPEGGKPEGEKPEGGKPEGGKPMEGKGGKADMPEGPDNGQSPAPEGAMAEGGAPPMGMGMMGGMGGMGMGPGGRRGGPGGASKDVKYEPTAWGRYAKVLLSSSEFLFIN